jgi:hypothetical protein
VATDIEVRRLINFETATDGTAVRLLVENVVGGTAGLSFAIETSSALLMTLPTMASGAVKRPLNDPTAHSECANQRPPALIHNSRIGNKIDRRVGRRSTSRIKLMHVLARSGFEYHADGSRYAYLRTEHQT